MKKLFSVLLVLSYFLAGNMCGLAQAVGGTTCEDKAASSSCGQHAKPSSPSADTLCCERLVAEKNPSQIEPAADVYKKISVSAADFNLYEQPARETILYGLAAHFTLQTYTRYFSNRAPPVMVF